MRGRLHQGLTGQADRQRIYLFEPAAVGSRHHQLAERAGPQRIGYSRMQRGTLVGLHGHGLDARGERTGLTDDGSMALRQFN